MTTINARQPEFPPLRNTQRGDEPRRKNRYIHWRLAIVIARRPPKGPPLESLSRRHNDRNENIAQRQPKTYSQDSKRSQTPQDHRRQQRTNTAHLVRSQNSERDPDNRRRNILLEGGGALNWSMLISGLVDDVSVTITPRILGGEKAVTLVEGKGTPLVKNGVKLKLLNTTKYGPDLVVRYKVLS